MIYGHGKTIHQTQELDIEVDENGKVVAVWFRCIALPFKQMNVDNERAWEMERLYIIDGKIPKLLAVEVDVEKWRED